MAIDIEKWSSDLTERLRGIYGERLLFAGLQGSYGRGEAAPDSDIDIVVILKSLSVSDLDSYRAVLDGMPHGELSCGFISGERELLSWTPSELFILYFDTVPLYGSLGPLSRLLMKGRRPEPCATEPARYITAAVTTISMKRAPISSSHSINPPSLCCARSISARAATM